MCASLYGGSLRVLVLITFVSMNTISGIGIRASPALISERAAAQQGCGEVFSFSTRSTQTRGDNLSCCGACAAGAADCRRKRIRYVTNGKDICHVGFVLTRHQSVALIVQL